MARKKRINLDSSSYNQCSQWVAPLVRYEKTSQQRAFFVISDACNILNLLYSSPQTGVCSFFSCLLTRYVRRTMVAGRPPLGFLIVSVSTTLSSTKKARAR
jgi:hypothetical protein